MIQLPDDEKLKLIADELEFGNTCYYAFNTGEVLTLSSIDPDEFEDITGEESDVPAILAQISASPDEYIKIEPPHSSEAFGYIEDFIETIPDGKTQNRFVLSIRKKGPFQQFRNCLLDYPEVRQKWFVYKRQRELGYIKDTIESNLPS